MNKTFKILGGLATFALPAIALAQPSLIGEVPGDQNSPTALSLLGVISSIFGVIIPILVTLAVIYVIWNVIKYTTADDDTAQDTARKGILNGIIALFVIVSIWGLVAIINRTFNIGQGGANVGNCQPVYDPSLEAFVVPPACQ